MVVTRRITRAACWTIGVPLNTTPPILPQEHHLDQKDLAERAAAIVSAYVSNNPVPATELPALIKSIHGALLTLTGGGEAEAREPMVPVKRSVTPDYVVCLEDGKKLKMLKRYLRSRFDMSPEQYRAKWGLPRDYPMVAPNYARQRSEFAKKIGLGRTAKPHRKRR